MRADIMLSVVFSAVQIDARSLGDRVILSIRWPDGEYLSIALTPEQCAEVIDALADVTAELVEVS